MASSSSLGQTRHNYSDKTLAYNHNFENMINRASLQMNNSCKNLSIEQYFCRQRLRESPSSLLNPQLCLHGVPAAQTHPREQLQGLASLKLRPHPKSSTRQLTSRRRTNSPPCLENCLEKRKYRCHRSSRSSSPPSHSPFLSPSDGSTIGLSLPFSSASYTHSTGRILSERPAQLVFLHFGKGDKHIARIAVFW